MIFVSYSYSRMLAKTILVVVIWLNSLRIRSFNNDKYIIDFPSLPLILFSFLDSVILYNNLFAPKKMYYKSNLVIWAQPFFLSHPSYYYLDLQTKQFSQTYGKGSPYPLSFYHYIHLPWGKWKRSHDASFIKNFLKWKYQFQYGESNGNNQ